MPKYKRLQRLLYHPCSYTANTSKQHTELYMGFSCDYTRSTDHDTRPAQAVIIPLAQSWSVLQRRNTSSAYQIPASCRTLYRSVQPPYYNNVYKGATVRPVIDPCQTVQHTADHAIPAGSAPAVCGSLASDTPGGAVQRQGRGGRRGTIGGYRRSSFRAFAR